MKETCIKCGHVNLAATGKDTDACPKCGVVYIKALISQHPRSRIESSADDSVVAFAKGMRSQSLYPTFRAMTNIGYWVGIIAAIVLAFVGVGALFVKGFLAGVAGLGSAALVWLLVRTAREAWFMLADLSDATVRIAQQGRER